MAPAPSAEIALKPLRKKRPKRLKTSPKPGNPDARSPMQIAADTARVSELYLTRQSHAKIAEQAGLSVQQVRTCLIQLQEEWLSRATWNFNQRQAEELARIDNLEAHYWDAYKRSQADALATEEHDGERPKTVTKKKKRDGDAEYLRGVQSCIEMRCKILGLNAPKEMIIEERRTSGKPVEAMNIAELQRELANKGGQAVDEAEWAELRELEAEERALRGLPEHAPDAPVEAP